MFLYPNALFLQLSEYKMANMSLKWETLTLKGFSDTFEEKLENFFVPSAISHCQQITDFRKNPLCISRANVWHCCIILRDCAVQCGRNNSGFVPLMLYVLPPILSINSSICLVNKNMMQPKDLERSLNNTSHPLTETNSRLAAE